MTFISDILHATGVLVGLAIGDAMGAPFEAFPESPGFVSDLLPGGRMARKSGRYTDDTLQALALAESLAACGKYCPEDFMERLIRDFDRFPFWYGPTSGAIFTHVREGVPLHAAARIVHAERGGSRSNGSVMRGAPIGVFYSGPEVEACSFACSALTHRDPVAGACSSFVNRMVSDMCRGIPKRRAWARAVQRCRIAEVADVLGRYRSYPRVPGLDALLATHAALSVFMETESFRETVPVAVSLGGDSDTVGAIAGALAGAAYGVHTIPETWRFGLDGSGRVWRAAYRLWCAALG